MNSTLFGKAYGVILVSLVAACAILIAQTDYVQNMAISPLIIGIGLGILLANTLCHFIPDAWRTGIQFSAKTVLRIAIVFYGFRITFQDVYLIGIEGIIVATTMLASTMILGAFIGIKLLGLDRDTSLLVSSGSAVCGAAAVLATEEVLQSETHKTAIAIATVVLFGTISMFLYPVLYKSGMLNMDTSQYGLYVGGSVHEVAQVVAAGSAIDASASDSAVIVKMTRVIMLAPMLLILGFSLTQMKSNNLKCQPKLVVPWFAVLFIVMIAFNSLQLLSDSMVSMINTIDTFLLTMAMTALGMGTHVSKFKQSGLRPVLLAAILFLWLLVFGYFLTVFINH